MTFKSPYCDCGNYATSNTDKCESCNREERKSEKSIKDDSIKLKKKLQYKPKKRSTKRAKQERDYLVKRGVFLNKNQSCQVIGCGKESNQVHHKAGRIGLLLLYTPLWLAVCETCHPKIEENPMWAKNNGYSVNRI